MGRCKLTCMALLAILTLPLRAASSDEIYSYVDAEGVLHFSNAPSERQYRRIGRLGPKPSARKVEEARRDARRPGRGARSYAEYEAHVRAAADKYTLPVELLRAVMSVESNFDHRAQSDKGAMGLMQLMPGTAREMYVTDAWDPAQNIDGGARYLRILANLYDGDVAKTLAAYNAGPAAVRRANGIPRIPETQQYVRKVMERYLAFRERT